MAGKVMLNPWIYGRSGSNPHGGKPTVRPPWEYLSVNVYPADRNSSGIVWYARTGSGLTLRSGTKEGMRRLIQDAQRSRNPHKAARHPEAPMKGLSLRKAEWALAKKHGATGLGYAEWRAMRLRARDYDVTGRRHVWPARRRRNSGEGRRKVARWQTKGNDFLELYQDQYGYGYTGVGAMGSLGNLAATDEEAIAEMERRPVKYLKMDRPSLKRVFNPGWLGGTWQGSRTVAFIDRFGKRRKGRIVMRSSQPGYWVLNMGGKHGTPAVVHENEIISGGRPMHKNAGRRRKYNKTRRTRRNAPLTVYVGRHRHTRRSLLKKYGPKQGHRYWRRAKTKYHGYGKSAATCTVRRKRKNRHNPMDRRLDARLVHWLTDYDQRQSAKKGYNRYALPQYFNALRESVEPAISQGKSLPAALKEGFIYPSRLLTAVAKGLAKDGLISASELNQLVPK